MVKMLALFLIASSLALVNGKGCYVSVPLEKRPSHVEGPQPPVKKIDDLPSSYDWRNMSGVMYVSPVTNQFVPTPCGSCWAHASVGALTDRFIIATKARVSMVRLSSQVLLNFGSMSAFNFGSCNGGSDVEAYKFIHQYGITDETCMPYKGVDSSIWGEIESVPERMCYQCDRFGACNWTNGILYRISQYGSLMGEEEMMNEIYNRGPIACSVYAHSPAFENYKTGIIVDKNTYNSTTHVVSIVGWGIDSSSSGIKYWIGRNSYGTAWGEAGWFKLQRGVNSLDIEKHPCAWAVPKI